MSMTVSPKLTPRDFAILETMLADHLGGDDLLVAAIRKKLEDAQIVFPEDLPGDVVTIGSRVAFTVDNEWPQERRLVTLQHYVPGQDHQSVASLRGIGLLGQAAGQKILIDFGGREVALEIHVVLYQPEADSKARRKPADLRLVVSRDDSQQTVPFQSALQREMIPVPLPRDYHCCRAVRPLTRAMAIGREGNPLPLRRSFQQKAFRQ